jgi:hypothetical protein
MLLMTNEGYYLLSELAILIYVEFELSYNFSLPLYLNTG